MTIGTGVALLAFCGALALLVAPHTKGPVREVLRGFGGTMLTAALAAFGFWLVTSWH